MRNTLMSFKTMVVCIAMLLGLFSSVTYAQMRQSDRCEVHQACVWNFQSPGAGAVQILRDTHEQKRKYGHYEKGGNVFITNEFQGGQTNNSSTTIGNINTNNGDGEIIANQSVDESILGAKTNTWSGDCTENCDQISNDPSVQKDDGRHGNSKY